MNQTQQGKLKTFLEIFSAATGISFLISASLHMLVFGFWGIDFTTVGTLEDVVLGGIRMFLGGLYITIMFCPMALVFVASSSAVSSKDFYSLAIAAISVGIVFLCMYFITSFGWITNYAQYAVGLLAFTAAAIISSVLILTSKRVRKEFYRFIAKSWIVLITFSTLISVPVVTYVTILGYKNLRFMDSSTLPSPCQADYRIAWIGRRAIVLRCSERIYVLLGEDANQATLLVFPPQAGR